MKPKYGYMGSMLFVNLSEMTSHAEELSEDPAKNFIGDYGIGSRVIYQRMKAGTAVL